uniref:ATP synthase F0 subunit 8 n=1 Tax=Dorymyrmex brunneus TaxID=609524 RepID=A0A343YVD8_9HYME|nr:ATP synthase F0 subunit 8 [Dorymyrmex brunneus]
MPQMMPMYWIYIFLFSISMWINFIYLIYFLNVYNPEHNRFNNHFNNSINKSNWTWKW